ARQHHHPRHLRSSLKLLAQLRDGAVAAAVIDEYEIVGAPEGIERRVQPLEQEGEPLLLVVDRDDDGDVRIHRRAPARISFVASTARSTSASSIAGNSGKVTVSRPMRSAFGNCPSW